MDDPRLRRHPFGFLEVADPPSPDELRRYYADVYFQTEQGSYRKSYSAAERDLFSAKLAQKGHLIDALRGGGRAGSFLDVGCGEGFALAWFAGRGWTVEGLDFSAAGVSAMNPQMAGVVTVGNLFQLLELRAEEGRRYDLVWLSNVLEHVLDPVGLLTAIRGLVTQDGMLVVTVPNDGSALQELLLENGEIPGRFWVAIPDHLAYFDRESLVRTAAETGWECLDVIGDFPIDLYLLHPGSNYVQDRARGPAAHLARLEFESLLARQSLEAVNTFYRGLAQVGLGRNLTAFLRLSS